MRPLIGITCSTFKVDGLVRMRHGVNHTYVAWVERCGGVPVILPNVAPDAVDAMLAPLHGLLATGGEDIQPRLYGAEPDKHLGVLDVPRDRYELPLVAAARERELPLFGICRGIQTLNVVAGGSLRQDLVHDPNAIVQHRMDAVGEAAVHHSVQVTRGSRLHAIAGGEQVWVNSYHHQAVDAVGEGLTVSGRAADGTIEAVEGEGDAFLLAVQWHPEMMPADDALTGALFAAFIDACTR